MALSLKLFHRTVSSEILCGIFYSPKRLKIIKNVIIFTTALTKRKGCGTILIGGFFVILPPNLNAVYLFTANKAKGSDKMICKNCGITWTMQSFSSCPVCGQVFVTAPTLNLFPEAAAAPVVQQTVPQPAPVAAAPVKPAPMPETPVPAAEAVQTAPPVMEEPEAVPEGMPAASGEAEAVSPEKDAFSVQEEQEAEETEEAAEEKVILEMPEPEAEEEEEFHEIVNPVEIRKVTFFSNDGDKTHPITCSNVFFKGELHNLGVDVLIQPTGKEMDVELHYLICNADGSPYSKEVVKQVHLLPDTLHVQASWGWKDPGNWNVATYIPVVYFKDASQEIRGKVVVRSGKYGTVKKLSSVSLFSGGETVPPEARRDYTETFEGTALRNVYFRLKFPGAKSEMVSYAHLRIYDDSNKLITNQLLPIRMGKNMSEYCIGWGHGKPGCWKRGKYIYEISLHGSNMRTGKFEVV